MSENAPDSTPGNGAAAQAGDETGSPGEPRFRHEIGSDVVLSGRIHFPADARVDGRLKGEVHADSLLLIGPTAEVDARIRASHLIVEGTLEGSIIESGRVELRSTARMIGSIEARSLSIELGARFEGSARTGLHDAGPGATVNARKKTSCIPESRAEPSRSSLLTGTRTC